MRLAVSLTLLLAALCVPVGARAPMDAVVVSDPRTANNAGLYFAMEEGYFAAEGIEIRLVGTFGIPQLVTAIIRGDVDVALNAPAVGMIQAIAQGAPMRFVADKGHAAPGDRSHVLMVRKDLMDAGRFRTLRDLKGLRIASAGQGTIPELLITHVVRNRALLAPSDVQRPFIAYTVQPSALIGKTVDAIVTGEPAVTQLETMGAGKALVVLNDVLPAMQAAVVIYGPRLVARDRGLGQRFMNAYLRGVHAYLRGKTARNIATLATYTGQDEQVIRSMVWPRLRADGSLNVERLMYLQSWWVREGLLERQLPADRFVDTAFARRASESLTQGR